MNIRYVGPATVREVGPYRWDMNNGFVQDVTDPEILENLLTYPKPDFEAAEAEVEVKQAKKPEEVENGLRKRGGRHTH